LQLTFAGKAAECRRSPRRCARHEAAGTTRSVLDCASPLALFHANPSRRSMLFQLNYQNDYLTVPFG
jgi:hypothetical protein